MHHFPRRGQSGSGFLPALSISAHVGQRGGLGVDLGAGCSASLALDQAGFSDAIAYRGFDHKVGDPNSDDEAQQLKSCRPDGQPGHFSLKGSDVHASPSVKNSNLDATGMRLVRRGCVVEFPHTGVRARVVKVRMGEFWTDYAPPPSAASFSPCCAVRVVA